MSGGTRLDKKNWERLQSKFPAEIRERIRISLLASMREIGITSVSSYMSPHKLRKGEYGIKGGKRRIGRRVGGTLLGILTSRLSRSILDQESADFGRESIRKIEIFGTEIIGAIGSRVPYALIHEKGGVIQHTNLFGRGISATITIPKRPYLQPAVDKSQSKIVDIFAKNLSVLIQRINHG